MDRKNASIKNYVLGFSRLQSYLVPLFYPDFTHKANPVEFPQTIEKKKKKFSQLEYKAVSKSTS